MSRDLSTMSGRVAAEVNDTDSDLAVLIKRYLNRRYFEVLRRVNWNAINEDYTISVSAGTQDYTLPSDFGSFVFVVDDTNNTELTHVTFEDLNENYPGAMSTSGTVGRYSVFRDDSGTLKVRFHYNPSQAITVAAPYIVKPAEMGDSDTPVIPIEDLLEIGATADVWRYKKFMARANVWERKFEKYFSDYVWEQESPQDKVPMFNPTIFNRNNLY